MNFPSIDIQGSILSLDTLSKIRSEQASFQLGKDFNIDYSNARLKDEISLAWQDAKGQWVIFRNKLNRLKEGDIGTTETRNFWIFPLLTNLGYNLTYNRQSEELNGKSFPISYRDNALDNFPFYIGGYHESLDRRPENKQLRISPHALLQEYLNYSEHLYGIVTNGRQLRLLRDANRITRLSYVEFNLEKMMEEDLYSDFVIFYRLLHASRMPKKMDGGPESIIENYHEEGLAAGSTIRDKLGLAVKGAIRTLANGFINHPNNSTLREVIAAGHLDENEYYRYQLRIIYRLLFLFVIEERNLVYADNKAPETKRFSQIYFNYYSLQRLRKLAKKLPPPEAHRHHDLWQGLISTFSLFEKKELGEKLGIMSLQGDLFGYNAISNSYYDLHCCYLSNAVLLAIIKALTYFENDNKTLIAVNYGGLDVEEFGSVYEGLLELKLTINKVEASDLYSCTFDSSNERGKSGSHYTPEELVNPLIKHSLDYLIDERTKSYYQKRSTKEATTQSLLSLKICDVACGSGHILLSAARKVATEIARVNTDEEQPNPLSVRKAMKDVVRNCIYGVDKNPLAVELCKIALWLEAHNPGEPLNFLDHHIKCGDAIVGLAHRNELDKGIDEEAFNTLSGDDKDIAKTFRDKNNKERKIRRSTGAGQQLRMGEQLDNSVKEAMEEYKTFNLLTETTPEEIERKAKAYKKFIDSKGFTFLKSMADTQVAQFFIAKTEANKNVLMTDEDFRLILSGLKSWQDRKVAMAMAVASENRFFHWFIEFPEVFNEGGFDCILGNPPFLGGKKISTHYGFRYTNWIKYIFPTKGSADLVAFFFRRIFDVIKNEGFLSLISTNTISQGDTRIVGLEQIRQRNGEINFAISSIKWPGLANVEVSIVSMFKGRWDRSFILNNKVVKSISTQLEDEIDTEDPYTLIENKDKSFIGTVVFGTGFVLEQKEALGLLEKDSKNRDVVLPYIIGKDLNTMFDDTPLKYVINFRDWDISKAQSYQDCFEIVREKVKPQRDEFISKGNQIHEYDYWKHWDRRSKLYDTINVMTRVLVHTRVSRTHAYSFQSVDRIFSDATIVFAFEDYSSFALLQSSTNEWWAWKYSSSMKGDRRYSPSDAFENFPFPAGLSHSVKQQLEEIGETYYEHRRAFMLNTQLGLTKTYHLFHSDSIMEQGVSDKHKNLSVFQKHFAKTPNIVSFDEAKTAILKLRELHVQMDTIVLDSYGWSDIQPRHGFYEVDYLPESDKVRFTIHPDVRKEILKRLSNLNHKIHAEEVAKGLWDKTKASGKKSKVEETNEYDTALGSLFD